MVSEIEGWKSMEVPCWVSCCLYCSIYFPHLFNTFSLADMNFNNSTLAIALLSTISGHQLKLIYLFVYLRWICYLPWVQESGYYTFKGESSLLSPVWEGEFSFTFAWFSFISYSFYAKCLLSPALWSSQRWWFLLMFGFIYDQLVLMDFDW